ncbi:MAG: aminotransferase class V-fold PLP-dependent enzyme, partial [Eubacterium sp.]|nr:aminotransferase class V-fold PLP-dependent enzyme [Eubacterium sp.]
HMYALKERLAGGLLDLGNVVLHGPKDLREGAPHILNASIIGVRAEVMLHTLEDRGIYVSSGSACSSHRRAGSATMVATKAERDAAESSIRFSFTELTTEEEIDYTLQVLREVVPQLRRFVRR